MPRFVDDAGNIWEASGPNDPNPVFVSGPQSQMPADPTYQYEGPQAAANVDKTQTDIVDTVEDNRREDAKLEADLFQRGLRRNPQTGSIEYIPGWQPRDSDKPATVIAQEEKKEGKRQKADVVRAIMRQTIDFYKQDLRGQPASRAFGATEYLPLPRNERFTENAQAMLSLIRPMVAMGAKDGDSDKEMQVFLSYIPNASDSDITIEAKLRNLERLLNGVVDGRNPSEVDLSRDSDTPYVDGLLNELGPPPKDRGGLTGPGLAQGGDAEKSIPIPEAMQSEHAAYLRQNWGQIDPQAYANFRAGLDRKYGFEPRPDAYRAIVGDLNNRAAQGGSPDGLAIPPVNAEMDGLEQVNASLFNNRLGGFAFGLGDQLGLADEMAGGVRSLIHGTDYDVEVARANAMKNAMQDAYAGENLAGNLSGAILSGAAIAKAFPQASAMLAGNTKRAIGTGSAFGAATGAGENNDNRAMGGALGLGLGVAGGAAGAAAAPVVRSAMDTRLGQAASRVGRGAWNRTAGAVAPSMRVAADPNVPQMRQGESLLPADVLDEAVSNLTDADNYGLPYSLADADPKLRTLAGSVSRRSPEARQLAENIFEPRARGQADRLVDAVDTRLAPVANVEQRGAELLRAGDQAAGPYYNLAFDKAGPVDPQIAAMLETPAGRAALSHARTIAANRGLDPNKLGFDLDEQGEVVLRSVPSYETLQLVKRGLDAHLDSFRDQFGNLNVRGNPLAQSVVDLQGRLNSRLGDLNPNYAEGNRVWSQYAQRKDALDQGYNVLPKNAVPQRQFDDALSRMGPEQMDEARTGYATAMADQADRLRYSGNPYDAVYGAPVQQAKVSRLFPDGARDFDRIYGLERDMAKTRHETLGGSPTAARLASDAQFDNGAMEVGTNIAADLAGGGGAFTGRQAFGKILQTASDALRTKGSKAKADAIAPVLFEPNPRLTLDYLGDLRKRKAQQTKRAKEFRRKTGLFGSIVPSAFLGAE
ncbi:hypothetical protein [Pelagerythrobacter marinus]|uniref:hypothetical protein n=1 Tax=Pelagerythrobacter marinus TaxID=538382 RepID=UPI002AC92860|nr:hypothetical protein [Pelagerythrobacter marinus]WPZ05484.1 hypothetical protein T8T98_08565 [Pelagerythrobacter marinus]